MARRDEHGADELGALATARRRGAGRGRLAARRPAVPAAPDARPARRRRRPARASSPRSLRAAADGWRHRVPRRPARPVREPSPAADRPATSRWSRAARLTPAVRRPRSRRALGSRPASVTPEPGGGSAMAPSDPRQTKFVLDETADPEGLVQHRRRPARRRRRRRCIRAPASRSARTTSRRCSRWRSSARRSAGEREIEIPEPVRDAYRLYRPTPAVPRPPARAGARYAGPHLLQVRGREPGRQPQAEHRHRRRPSTTRRQGVKRLATETGAGQWGSALAFAGACFGLEVKVYMVRASYDQKPYRRDPDGDVRRRGRRQPVAGHELRPQRPRRDARLPGLARASRSARRSRTPRPATTRSTRSGRCSTTCCCTRRSSARRRSSRWRMAGE